MAKIIKILMKKKIILIFTLIIVLIGAFFLKTNLPLEKLELKKLISALHNKISVFSQEISYSLPRYPERLRYLVSEIVLVSEEINGLNKELDSSVRECNCSLAKSRCGLNCQPTGVFGEICPVEVKEKEEEIKELNDRLSFLQNLLEKELAALSGQQTEELKNDLENLLNKNQEIISLAENNRSLSANCSTQTCVSVCQKKLFLGIKACLEVKSEQKPITIKFKTGLTLRDLDLGQVKISKIKLDLPTELHLPRLPKLSPITIPFSGIDIDMEREDMEILTPITINLPQPFLPLPQEITLSCSQQTAPSSYNYSRGGDGHDISTSSSNELAWYFKTLEWLSGKCQELPGMKDELGLPATTTECFDEAGNLVSQPEGCSRMEGCFMPETVALTFINACDQFWEEYFRRYEIDLYPPERNQTCEIIGAPDSSGQKIRDYGLGSMKTRTESAIEKCTGLFEQEGEAVPPACQASPNETLKDKCGQLRESGREEVPEPCKLLPLFTGKIEFPAGEEFGGGFEEHAGAKIIDYPSEGFCPPSFPTIPKISLPSIPGMSIKLPDIKLWPFLEIYLPDFIFEGLDFPEIDLCNLDNCQAMFPSLSLRLPVLKLPLIEISPIKIPWLGIELRINPLQLPPIPFNMPQLPELSLFSLTRPELELPSISSLRPKLFFKFDGLDLHLFSALLEALKTALGISDISACMDISLKLPIPLKFGMDDYIWSWPAFPRIPDFCGPVDEFCQKVKASFSKLTNETKKIEDVFNLALQNEIQVHLDRLIPKIKQRIEEEIEEKIEKRIRDLVEEIRDIEERIGEEIEKGIRKIGERIEEEIDEEIKEGIRDIGENIKEEIEEEIRKIGEEIEKKIEEGRDIEEEIGEEIEKGIRKIEEEIDEEIKEGIRDIEEKIGEEIGEEIKEGIRDIGEKIKEETEKGIRDIGEKIGEEIEEEIEKGIRDIVIDGIDLNELMDFDFPATIPISWPDSLKEIRLSQPLVYSLPKIPLSQYSFEKTLQLKLPGFQGVTFEYELSGLFRGDYTACESKKPITLNPCPANLIQANRGQIENLKQEMSQSFQNIIKVLE